MVYWFALALAIVFEVAGTMSLKYAAITNSMVYAALTFCCYLLTFTLMWYAIKKLDISLAYAIWAGVGVALITFGGMVLFNESFTPIKIFFIAMIIIGVVGLKISDTAQVA